MKKNVFYTFILVLALLGMVLWALPLGIFSPKQSIAPTPSSTVTFPYSERSGEKDNSYKTMEKKILMVVAFKDFKDEEYFVTKEVLEKAGFLIETTSSQKGMALGTEGGEAVITLLPSEINPQNYEGILFVGGSGMGKELDNHEFQKLAQEFAESNKIVSAICVAPSLLAKAGVLKGIKATVWSSALDKSFIKILEENGTIYENKSVVQDGKVVTANGPAAAQEFGEAIVSQLKI
ncbi:MAG: DJ-1/PfpI family protein [Candidatus Falkowbacteria bacterium]|nr:DJ-1/PfpI family protein [Candidatus Falkowbacteria bacterium]